LAPYYQQTNRPVRSHGCAGAEDAHGIVMQRMPNLALEPHAGAIQLADLVANVQDGICITDGWAASDFQARTGRLGGTMREIKNGKLGRGLTGGEIRFVTADFFKHVTAVGGAATQQTKSWTQYALFGGTYVTSPSKGEPAQRTSASVRAAAATITEQALINPLAEV
jgi:TldD protein